MEISCIIPTRNRADSLRTTLECLATADRANLQCEVVVVDNGSCDGTADVARDFMGHLKLRYLHEPVVGNYGKAHCLNRALDAGGLGSIVAILDDDMSPESNWWQAVAAACRRWPGKDIFTGRSHVIWPCPVGEVPTWAKRRRIRGWAFSVMDGGTGDREFPAGRWFSGNHLWMRSRVLLGGRRLLDLWPAESRLQLDLQEEGCQGVMVPDAVAGHRVQPGLLDFDNLMDRGRLVGREFARIRLDPFRPGVNVAVCFKDRPVLTRGYCHFALLAWRVRGGIARFLGDAGRGLWREERLVSCERASYYKALLIEVSRHRGYSLRPRGRHR